MNAEGRDSECGTRHSGDGESWRAAQKFLRGSAFECDATPQFLRSLVTHGHLPLSCYCVSEVQSTPAPGIAEVTKSGSPESNFSAYANSIRSRFFPCANYFPFRLLTFHRHLD